jgi:hypothetical protein
MKATLAAMAFIALGAGQAQAACPSFQITRSATVARDINGISLGMRLAEVNQIAPVWHLAFNTYTLELDGIDYEVEVSPLGRVFQIDSSQRLGSFAPDRQFAATLTQRLAAKYGEPGLNQLPGAPAVWSLVEQVDNPNVGTFARNTMHFSVMLSEDEQGVVLEMMMQDFRILWQDQASLNCAPTREGERRIQF